jgi:hypothetical protein
MKSVAYACGQQFIQTPGKLELFNSLGINYGRRRRRLFLSDEFLARKKAHEARDEVLFQTMMTEMTRHRDQCANTTSTVSECLSKLADVVQLTVEMLDWAPRNVLASAHTLDGNLDTLRRIRLGEPLELASGPFRLNPLPHRFPKFTRRAGQCYLASDAIWDIRIRINAQDATIRCYPNVLIIGVQKGSTTELRNTLVRSNPHSVRAVSPWKFEPHMLDNNKKFRCCPITSYLADVAVPPSVFFKSLQVVLDKSPSYYFMGEPLNLLDGINLVLVLRDPSERLFSHYFHACLLYKVSVCVSALFLR